MRLAASQSRVQEIQHQDYKHHSCLLIYELTYTPDLGNPANFIQRIREYRNRHQLNLQQHTIKSISSSLSYIYLFNFKNCFINLLFKQMVNCKKKPPNYAQLTLPSPIMDGG